MRWRMPLEGVTGEEIRERIAAGAGHTKSNREHTTTGQPTYQEIVILPSFIPVLPPFAPPALYYYVLNGTE